jgi:hypothetical protein
MSSKSFGIHATVTASTKRNPSISGGKRGTPTTNISSLSCTPLDPVTPEIATRAGLNTPYEALETYVDADLDIIEGDILIVDTSEYQIKAVAEWGWRHGESEYLQLVLEELKT